MISPISARCISAPGVRDVAENCVFCDIVAGKFNTPFIYEDDAVVAFADLKPMAPTHVLVVPREHHTQLKDAAAEERLLGRLLAVAGKVVKNGDFRVVVNNGPQ